MGSDTNFGVDSIKLSGNSSQTLGFASNKILDKNRLKTIPVSVPLQSVAEDVTYLNIIYYKWDRHESVSSDQNTHIDYVTAISEMEKLDWTFTHNNIGFTNKRKWITIQFVKLEIGRASCRERV